MKCILSIVAVVAFAFPAMGLAKNKAPKVSAESFKDTRPAPAPAPGLPGNTVVLKPYIKSLGVYGSTKINEKVLRKHFGKQIDAWFNLGIEGDPKSEELQKSLTDSIVKKFNLAWAEWSILEYFQPDDLAMRVTLNVVEKKDQKKRMPFHAEPKGNIADPDGLLESWHEYGYMATNLANEGRLNPYEAQCGPAFHCLFGHKGPKLKPYLKKFTDGVSKNQSKLIHVLKNDRNEEKRATAAFLLAYMKNGKKLVSLMIHSSKDPHPLVRNNALRILGDVAEGHPELVIPVQPLIQALDYPAVSDRSKAIYALYAMAENSKAVRKQLLRKAVPNLLTLLKSNQPNESEATLAVLQKISGKNFPLKAQKDWEKWAKRLPADLAKP